jgi:hypothetical protein
MPVPTANAAGIHLDSSFGHHLRHVFVSQRILEIAAADAGLA